LRASPEAGALPTAPPSGWGAAGDGFLARASPHRLLSLRTLLKRRLQPGTGRLLVKVARSAPPLGKPPQRCDVCRLDRRQRLVLSYERGRCWCGPPSRGDGESARRSRQCGTIQRCPCACCLDRSPSGWRCAASPDPRLAPRGHQRRARQPRGAAVCQRRAMLRRHPAVSSIGVVAATGDWSSFAYTLHLPRPAACGGEALRPRSSLGVPEAGWAAGFGSTQTPALCPIWRRWEAFPSRQWEQARISSPTPPMGVV